MVVPSQAVSSHCVEILTSPELVREKDAIQHGSVSVYEHSVAVANACASLARMLPFRISMRPLVRAALLHDYFLYDWHDRAASRPHHATRHGSYARENAERDFAISAHEGAIIESHMFPLAQMPRSREAWLLCLVDKGVSLKETAAGLWDRLRQIHG